MFTRSVQRTNGGSVDVCELSCESTPWSNPPSNARCLPATGYDTNVSLESGSSSAWPSAPPTIGRMTVGAPREPRYVTVASHGVLCRPSAPLSSSSEWKCRPMDGSWTPDDPRA
eukprot:722351-Prymnesium_polylepis.2